MKGVAVRIRRGTRRLRDSVSWEARLLIGALALAGASVAVFRATLPDTQPLAVRDPAALLDASGMQFAALLDAHAGVRLVAGNRVDVLLNGDNTYPRLWADLRAARRSITVQSYYAQPGAVADTLADILATQALRGIDVRLLLDAFGAAPMPRRWMDDLRRAGVRVALLRPIHWHSMHGAGDRSHVRIVVIDGRVAYTGGFGFADHWNGNANAARRVEWRETNARLEGPAARQFQGAFAAAWVEASGDLLVDDAHFPQPESPTGGADAALLFTTTTTGTTTAERFLALTMAAARRRLLITNSYFVPNADLRRLLVDAVGRGVDVRVLTAGRATDVATTWYAGRRHYEELLRGGVKLYEYEPATLHAKAMVVDGLWSTIGSMNLDNRSLAFNDESTLLVRDVAVARQMGAIFDADLRHAREITLDAFRRRSVGDRLLEQVASWLSAVL